MGSETVPELISELMHSECEGDRVRTKLRFTNRFQDSDSKLDNLVKANFPLIKSVVEINSKIMGDISNSKARCQTLKDKIIQCRETLQCHRDDIRKLWLESLEHKHAHQMLEEIEKLRQTPEKVNKYLHSKKYILATEVVVSSLCLLEGDLRDVEGLSELRADMNRLKEKLYYIFMEEVRQELYWSTFHFVYSGSGHTTGDLTVVYEKCFHGQSLTGNKDIVSLNSSYVKVLLECISLLQKWPETIELLKEDCQKELVRIVQKLSKLMFDMLQKCVEQPLTNLPEPQQHRFLLDLLQTIFEHFKCIALNHKEFFNILGNVNPSASSHESCAQVDIYSDIQITIEQFVTRYLDQQTGAHVASISKASVFTNTKNMNDVSSFFETNINRGCPILFQFVNSSMGMKKNKNSEQLLKSSCSDSNMNLKDLNLVCKPAVKNITFIFLPLKRFISEIESFLPLGNGVHCSLHTFLYDSALVFLDQVNSEINKILENASVSLESWSVSSVNGDLPNSETQILSSTLVLYNNLKELHQLSEKIPDYSGHFLHLIHYVILDYKDMLQKAFKNLFGEDHNILSVSWAKDRDIRRLLKSFSNWKHLEETKSGDGITFPEEVRLRNQEESQLLMRNLRSEEHGSWEMITDFNTLLNLAILQESSQWFSVKLLSLMNEFLNHDIDPNYVLPSTFSGLKKMIKEYEDFADICLLTLHLEVRARCFHYLLPTSEAVSFDTFLNQDFELSVQRLTADLAMIDETLHPVLTAKELKYIFEGVGELVASILIHNISTMNVASQNLVKRVSRCIFILQCRLSSITLVREVALERARRYIQTLNMTCEDILNEILEEGPVFKESEYVSLFQLILGKEDTAIPSLQEYVLKLQKIFKKVTVTI